MLYFCHCLKASCDRVMHETKWLLADPPGGLPQVNSPRLGSTRKEHLPYLGTLTSPLLGTKSATGLNPGRADDSRGPAEPTFFQQTDPRGKLGCMGSTGLCVEALASEAPSASLPSYFGASTDAPFCPTPNNCPFDGHGQSLAMLILEVSFLRAEALNVCFSHVHSPELI